VGASPSIPGLNKSGGGGLRAAARAGLNLRANTGDLVSGFGIGGERSRGGNEGLDGAPLALPLPAQQTGAVMASNHCGGHTRLKTLLGTGVPLHPLTRAYAA